MTTVTADVTEHLLLAVEKVDLPPTTKGILSLVERVLEKPYVTEIHIQTDAPIQVKWYRAPGDTLMEIHGEKPEMTLSRIELDEDDDADRSFPEALVAISSDFFADNLEVTHIICSSTKEVAKSLGFPNPRFLGGALGSNGRWVPAVLGIPLVESVDCPVGWVVVCGGTGGRLNSVTRGIKTPLRR